MSKGMDVDENIIVIFNFIIGAAIGLMVWDKKQDKLKLKELDSEVQALKEKAARQDERHKALMADVQEMKSDIKEIKHMLMGR